MVAAAIVEARARGSQGHAFRLNLRLNENWDVLALGLRGQP